MEVTMKTLLTTTMAIGFVLALGASQEAKADYGYYYGGPGYYAPAPYAYGPYNYGPYGYYYGPSHVVGNTVSSIGNAIANIL
jgi:hypothetical protein